MTNVDTFLLFRHNLKKLDIQKRNKASCQISDA